MIVKLMPNATPEQVERVRRMLVQAGYADAVYPDETHPVVGAVGTIEEAAQEDLVGQLSALAAVKQVVRVSRSFRLASRDWKMEGTSVPVSEGLVVGGRDLVIMAGPCAVESRDQILKAAWEVKQRGADVLRGGAFKPRTSPHTFQGLGQEGLRYLKESSQQTGLPVITEVMDARDIESVAEVAAILQIGSRNMQNYTLLKEVGHTRKPVLLKRGMCATIEEWLQAAEYVLSSGNPHVILCERGIRTFETYTRNTLDLNAIPVIKKLTHLPVIVDPSHGTGAADMVIPMSLASIAAGADGLIVEVHPNPRQALSDGAQSLTPAAFSELILRSSIIAQGVGRSLRFAIDQSLGRRLRCLRCRYIQ